MSISSDAFMGIAIVGVGISVVALGMAAFKRFEKEKQRKQSKKISGGVEKIDRMLGDGKITGEEARELKQALGIGAPITPKELDSDKHIRAVSIIHMFYGCLVMGITIGSLFYIKGQLASDFPESESSLLFIFPSDDSDVGDLFDTLNLISSILFPLLLLWGVLELASAAFLLKRSRQARSFILLFSILMLPSFPLGTALGIYSLWVLFFREGAEAYFPEARILPD